MESSLHDYSQEETPKLHLTRPVRHPTNTTDIIGHIGTDKAGDGQPTVAAFPRKKGEHWFRGNSTSGLTGYGISEDILDHLTGHNTVNRVIIVETDNGRVIEYDIAAFKDATVVAYSPKKEECVIGDDPKVDDDVFHDRQRVVPVEKARRTFEKEEVVISQ